MDSNLVVDYTQWERGKDYPEFFDEVALSTISRGYLLPGETCVNSNKLPLFISNNAQPIVFVDISRPNTFGLSFKFLFILKNQI